MTELHTDRLLLRHWRESDHVPWAALNGDPEVRAFFPGVLTAEQSRASAEAFQADLDQRGWGWWAVEVRRTAEFVGMAGLDPVDDDMSFTGVEAGWRLARPAWGHGYATEAARAVLRYGFERLGLPEVLAITPAANHRSRAVMRRLGMTHDASLDFDDPEVPDGPLRRTVVHRVRAAVGRA